jgi:hypothetical protein
MVLITLAWRCTAVPIYPIIPEIITGTVISHPAALINAAMEENLPNELRNNFYKDANIAAGLARESWFIDKETQVQDNSLFLSITLKVIKRKTKNKKDSQRINNGDKSREK